jgi:hypothetical protein
MLRSNPSPADLAEMSIDCAEAKEAYFKALRAEVPELMKIAMGKKARPPELDTFGGSPRGEWAAALRRQRANPA